jgi:hypothetical protein
MYMETDTRPIKWKIFVSFKFQLTVWQPINGEGINKYFNLKKCIYQICCARHVYVSGITRYTQISQIIYKS